MTAKQPAAPAKASPVTQAKAKPTAGAAAAKKPALGADAPTAKGLSLIHIYEPTRPY